jgi:PAS domain S-box-containing protein
MDCVDRGVDYHGEFRTVRPDGTIRWLAEVGRPTQVPGQPDRMVGITYDITERKQAEAELREKQSLLQAILDYSPTLISIKDLRGNVILANRNFAVLDAPPLHELIGRNVFDLFPEEVARALWQNDLAALKAGAALESEETVKHKDGQWHTYLTVKFPVYRSPGEPFGTCAISTDITERQQIAAALNEAGERNRVLFEGASQGILMADIETKTFRYANPAVCKMLGYSAEELVHLGVANIHPPADLPQVVAVFEAQARGDRMTAFDVPCLRKDGSVIFADIASSILVIGGRTMLVGFFADATERREAEARLRDSEALLRLALDAARMGAFDWDIPANHITWSRWHEELWGIWRHLRIVRLPGASRRSARHQ